MERSRARDLRNAVLLIDKHEGTTSYETVREIRRVTGARKAGHSGTLDRFASGLLIVCTGQATKVARFLLEDDKTYVGAVKLGTSTETDDREGAVIDERPVGPVTRADIVSCARKFTGDLLQLPPRYSALKINGRRASDRARNGESVNIAARWVRIYDFEVRAVDLDHARFFFRVRCSKGTYVRSLARDMGRELGTGAHLERLRRTDAGLFSIGDAVTVPELSAYVAAGTTDKRFALTPAEALRNYGRILVSDGARRRILNGAVFPYEEVLEIEDNGGKKFIIIDENENLIAIADVDIGQWQIKYLNVFKEQL
ncbi:MAG: tRNA pseudouridine(55) synthase TruB [Spirochaetes bacterium RBG_13_51_14]|nr:MAG: tRNA pseudouridine(55) synthase TruB [Spirochaetes bacterium RBG_13_51_14]